ncbi:APC family permease [Sporolactobacillus sp. KGMB 08714]|uniref:APC family permease n=1 Tax=Sporolactobacillus sp. KGMB 08714 TaxID=3064704 RepID=UPI002FBDB6BA
MSYSMVNAPSEKGGLRSQCLSFIEVLGQSIANIAPTATPAITIPVVFATSGNATWIAYVFATLAIILLSLQINIFSKRSATTGALYTYISEGIGSAGGFVSGSGLVFSYLVTGSAVLCGFANYANNLLAYAGIQLSPALIIIMGTAAAWFMTYKGVELSAKVMLVFEAISVMLITLLGILVLTHHGFSLGTSQFNLKGVSFDSLRLGLVFAFFSFVGFESATTMGREAKEPLRNIPRAVIGSGIFVGIFFVAMSLIMVMGFAGSKTSLGESTAPLTYLAQQSHVGILGFLISIGAMVSFWSCGVASITAAARVMLHMSHEGYLPDAVGKCHKINKTPYVAIMVCSIVVGGLPVALELLRSTNMDVYNWTGSMAVYGFLINYLLVTVSAPLLLYKLKELKWPHVVTAVLSFILLCIPLIGSVYPFPAFPMAVLPIVFLGWLIISLVFYIFVKQHMGLQENPNTEQI